MFYRQDVSYEEAQKIKDDYNFDIFLETSAKNGLNVNILCCQIVKILYENFVLKKLINEVNNIFLILL